MSTVESIRNKMAKVKVEVEEKITILGEKSEECVGVMEKVAKTSVSEMEEKLNYLGERSGECVNLIQRVAKKSVGHLKATLYIQNKSCEDMTSATKPHGGNTPDVMIDDPELNPSETR